MDKRTITRAFFDRTTGTVTYVVSDPATRRAAIIDPVLDYDSSAGRTGTDSADAVLSYLAHEGLAVDWILETHAHADHLSAARYLQRRAGGRVGIGENIRQVQQIFKKFYNLEREFLPDGSQFDHLFADGETLRIGSVDATALLVPGHTPADMAYRIDGSVFVGDTLFGRTWARRAPTFRAATRARCTDRSAGCSGCRATPRCTCATTTRRRRASRAGRPRWPSSVRSTCTCETA